MNPFLNLINQTLVDLYIYEDKTLLLKFYDYNLTIYNNYCPDSIFLLEQLKDKKIIAINIKDDDVFELRFEKELNLIVFIDNNSYKTPEAMQLVGLDNLIAIWQ